MVTPTQDFLGDTRWHGRAFSGEWLAVAGAVDVIEPATGRIIGRIGMASADEIGVAASKARVMQAQWCALPFAERSRILRNAAPVAPITVFEDEDEAVRLANRGEYGLSAGVLGSMARAMQVAVRLSTGLLHINDQTVADEVVNPFGGRRASGNGTSIGGPANWEEFTQWQWLTVAGRAPTYPF